jgi:general nucleoside transport system permease protein
MNTTEQQTIAERAFHRIRVGYGIALLVTALLIFLLFGLNIEAGLTSTFGLNLPSSQALAIPNLVIPAQATVYALTMLVAFLGAFQLARGIHSTGWLIAAIAFTFVLAFLIWASQGKSFNMVGMLQTSIIRATPIALAAMCGVMSERAGVVNIGIEGIMLMSAQAAVISASLAGNLYVGLLAAILMGGLVAAIHAFLVIRFKVDQIVSGVAINIFGVGMTSFISSRFLEKAFTHLNVSGTFPIVPIPLLSKIPVIGPVLFENNIVIYLTFVVIIVAHVVLFYTPWGLRTRAVGEHPKAADTLGINVYLMRYVNVIIGGMIAGLGGAYFTIGAVGRFDQAMTGGKGFIGLAAMIFGNWTPFGAYLASLVFGFADSLQVRLQVLNVPIPSAFLLMAPYIVTMIVLTGVIGKSTPPAADGIPYEK